VPVELRRVFFHVLLHLQHQVLHVDGLLSVQSAELLQEVGMLLQHLLPAVLQVHLLLQLVLLRPARQLLLHVRRRGRLTAIR
jgi:hypothetical protein